MRTTRRIAIALIVLVVAPAVLALSCTMDEKQKNDLVEYLKSL